eukprot:scaffold151841_cov33-Tisochrysis_lutea.AAC.1
MSLLHPVHVHSDLAQVERRSQARQPARHPKRGNTAGGGTRNGGRGDPTPSSLLAADLQQTHSRGY